jgi:coproporphyrinogen III oxidase
MSARHADALPTGVLEAERTRRVHAFVDDLQSRLCNAFEALEPAGARFESTRWTKPPEHRLKGGGHMRVMRGEVLEKVGVNVSHVWGTVSAEGLQQLPGAEQSGGAFSACGISLVAHPRNPYAPTGHMNLRFLTTSRGWFGGGADLTPAIPFDDDTHDFHAALRGACDAYRDDAYAEYKAWCDRYFFLPHRNEPRGVGGVFFDNLDSGDWERDFAFLCDVGVAFLSVYPAIVARRCAASYGEAEKQRQLVKRGRYVEFNLVYDRGTRFGFMTDANPDAYLVSLPPLAAW